MKNLTELLQNITPIKIIGNTSINVSTIQFDSRRVEKGDLFIATRGTAVDGHAYIVSAIEKGAAAIVCEEFPAEDFSEKATIIQVKKSLDALGVMACNWYDNPSRKLKLTGVTGTNGKTTIATLLYQLFRQLGYKAGLLSTVCNYIEDEEIEATHTTPDPIEMNGLLARMEIGRAHV